MSTPTAFQLRQRVWVTPFLGDVGDYPRPSYDGSQRKQHRARVITKPQLVRTGPGEELVADRQAWVLSPTRAIDPQDRVELPDGSTPPIVRVIGEPDPQGRIKTYRILFGNSRRTG